MKLDRIVFTDRGRQIMGTQFYKQAASTKLGSLTKSLTQRATLTKLSKSMDSSSVRTRLTPQIYKQLTQNLDKKFIFGSPQKHKLMHLRFLNSQILKEKEDQNRNSKFLNQKANIISRKFLHSLQTIENYNRIQEQKHKLKSTRLEVNMRKNYINRIVHRHRNEQDRYKRMLQKMGKNEKVKYQL